MYVKDYMTRDPFCISAQECVSRALDIMEQYDFHRLPVIDEENRLIGLVTEGLIADSDQRELTSMSIYELNRLLVKTTCGEIMIRDVITIEPDALLEEAAGRMREEHISDLPIVDEENHVVGIITENDIFQAFMDLLGYSEKGMRFVIHEDNDRPGLLEKICGAFARENINILNIGVYHNSRGIEFVVLAGEECPQMKTVLEKDGWEVADVRLQEGRIII